MEFWLTDSSEPLPSAAPQAGGGVSSPLNPLGGGSVPGLPGGRRTSSPGNGVFGGGGGAGLAPAASLGGIPGLPPGLAGAVTGAGGAMGAAAIAAAVAPSSATGLGSFSFQPPAEELVQAVGVLVRYVYTVEPQAAAPGAGGSGAEARPPAPAQGGAPWLPVTPVVTYPPPGGRLAAPGAGSGPLLASASFHPSVQVGYIQGRFGHGRTPARCAA